MAFEEEHLVVFLSHGNLLEFVDGLSHPSLGGSCFLFRLGVGIYVRIHETEKRLSL